MARSRNYDDYSEDRVSRQGNSSSRVLLLVILISVVICAVAVFCWVKILEAEEKSSKMQNYVAKQQVVELVENDPEPSENSVSSIMANISLDEAYSSLKESTQTSEMDYISSSDFTTGNEDDNVSEQGIEMKKPLIAQNLSISQSSGFSKDMVKYQSYTIKEGDSLVSIAQSFGLDVQTIISVNQITSPSSLFIGSTIQIPDRDGTLYVVRENDTLFSIKTQYGLAISAKTLGDVNGIREDSLKVGQRIFIPYETVESSGTISSEAEQSFSRPSSGKTVGMYNQKVANPTSDEAMQLDGILIQSTDGDAVLASESGTVVDKGFNENGSGFVKIMHANGYSTYYNYLSEVCVETTEKVEKGQVIGYFGTDTTKLATPTVFFRIEQGGVALDPNSFF